MKQFEIKKMATSLVNSSTMIEVAIYDEKGVGVSGVEFYSIALSSAYKQVNESLYNAVQAKLNEFHLLSDSST